MKSRAKRTFLNMCLPLMTTEQSLRCVEIKKKISEVALVKYHLVKHACICIVISMEHLNEANWKRENSNLATCEVYSVEQNDLNSREISLGFILGLNTWSFQPVKIN